MTQEQLKAQFIEECIKGKDKMFVSEPLNIRHSAMFDSYKRGYFAGKRSES
jgi:hypothetical protein